jgi:hypothetical protein
MLVGMTSAAVAFRDAKEQHSKRVCLESVLELVRIGKFQQAQQLSVYLWKEN